MRHAPVFFNLRNDVTVDDPDGKDLPDVEAVRAVATAQALDMAKVSLDETGRIDLKHRIEVVDEAGAPVLTVEFRDAVRVESDGAPVHA
ncbi:MAG TPA: hypothetical protein VNT42_14265 [Sphingomonas sp.]|nr:hypothetical protein [Sphingomonas sp.]